MNLYRPKIKPPLERTDKVLDALAIILLLATWGLAVYGYFTLPEIIPIHFNTSGEPDNEGSRISILFLPVLATIIISGMIYLNRHPHLFNYPSDLNPENAGWHYLQATRLIRMVKCSVALVFMICIIMIIQGARHKSLPYNGWELPLIIGIVLMPIVLYFITMRKAR